MRYCVILIAIVAAAAAEEHPFFKGDRLQEVVKISKKCIESTHVNVERLNKWRGGDISEPVDEAFKKYINCTFRKLGFANEDGTINHDNLKKGLAPSDIASKAMEPCYDKHGDNSDETAFVVYKCFKEHVPAGFKAGL